MPLPFTEPVSLTASVYSNLRLFIDPTSASSSRPVIKEGQADLGKKAELKRKLSTGIKPSEISDSNNYQDSGFIQAQ